MTPEQKKIIDKAKKQSKGAWKKSRTKEPVVGGELPGGIVGGIARFADYRLSENDEGKISLGLTGIVIKPEEFAGIRATKMHFLSESDFNTIDEAYDGLYSDMQLLGVDTSDEAHDDLETILADCEALKKERRPYKFNTSKKNKEARTKIWIQGLPDQAEIDELQSETGPVKGAQSLIYDGGDDGDDGGDDTAAADDDGGEYVPEVGQTVGWCHSGKEEDVKPCKIVKVLKSKQTVDLKRISDNKIFKDKSFESLWDLEESDE